MNIRDDMSSVIQSIPSSSPDPVTAEHATMLQCRLENFSLLSSRASAIWIRYSHLYIEGVYESGVLCQKMRGASSSINPPHVILSPRTSSSPPSPRQP